MLVIALSEDEARKFASWLRNRFDEEFDCYNENKINDFDEDAEVDLESMAVINTVYKQLDVAVGGITDLLETYKEKL